MMHCMEEQQQGIGIEDDETISHTLPEAETVRGQRSLIAHESMDIE